MCTFRVSKNYFYNTDTKFQVEKIANTNRVTNQEKLKHTTPHKFSV